MLRTLIRAALTCVAAVAVVFSLATPASAALGPVTKACRTDRTGHQLCAQVQWETLLGGQIRADAKVWCTGSADGIYPCAVIDHAHVWIYRNGVAWADDKFGCGDVYYPGGCPDARVSMSTPGVDDIGARRARIIVYYGATDWGAWGSRTGSAGVALDLSA